ncbi:MAG TPA: VWA domain-containing protein, partial [Aggregatilineales bacterium]|nr:VWA domain-containing protein [Aggregatilineales bacterium]
MPQPNNLYEILGVPPSAPVEDIRKTYRSAERRFHPDVNPHPGAARQFEYIKSAYDVLGDPDSRAAYDSEHLKAGAEKAHFSLRMTPSKRVLRVIDETQVLYLLMELIPEHERTPEVRESNLNLTIVLDHSTSMNGIRLERTRAAAYQIIDQLTERDMLSVVTFSDRAEVLFAANPVTDKPTIRAMVATMQAAGGTEIFQGLEAGLKENQRHAGRKFVNHIILLTDGKTYGDEEECLKLADKAVRLGIGISAMGLGDEWNDEFLDQLAGRTGGTSQYISSPNAVVRFLNDCVRALGRSLAERVAISIAPDPDIMIESAFRLSPSSQPLSVASDPIPL